MNSEAVLFAQVACDVAERPYEAVSALGPGGFIRCPAFFFACLERGTHRFVVGMAAFIGLALFPDLGVVGLDLRQELLIDGVVARRPHELGRTLEDRQVSGFPGDDRDRLHAARAGADDPDALAFKVNPIVGPAAGVVPLTREGIETWNIRDLTGRDAADRGDQIVRRYRVALIGCDLPKAVFLVKVAGGDARVELDIAAQIVAVGDVVEVRQDFGLQGELAAPVPFLEQILVE